MAVAWQQTKSLLASNRDMVLIVGGVFFVLPTIVIVVMMPGAMNPQFNVAASTTQQMAEMQSWMYSMMGYSVILGLVQYVGMIGLISLFIDDGRPTLGEALLFGLKAAIPLFLAYIVLGIGVGIVIGLPIGLLASFAPPALTFIVGFLLIIAVLLMAARLVMTVPSMCAHNSLNPFKAIRESWNLTGPSFWRLVGFYLLMLIAFIAIVVVISVVTTLLFSLFSPTAAVIANGIVSAIAGGAWACVITAAMAATYWQLSGHFANVAQEFE